MSKQWAGLMVALTRGSFTRKAFHILVLAAFLFGAAAPTPMAVSAEEPTPAPDVLPNETPEAATATQQSPTAEPTLEAIQTPTIEIPNITAAAGASPSQGITIHLDVSGSLQFGKDQNGLDVISLPGFSSGGLPGAPALPSKLLYYAIPPDADPATVQIIVTSSQVQEVIGKYDIAPVQILVRQGSEPTQQSERPIPPLAQESLSNGKLESIYETDAFYPGVPVKLERVLQMRRWRFVSLVFTPLQYNPVSKQVQLITSVDVRIGFENGALPEGMNDTFMNENAAEMFANYSEALQWYPTRSETAVTNAGAMNYVVITTNQIYTATKTKIDQFLAEKRARGLTTAVITGTQYDSLIGEYPNGTAQKIRQWLKDNYLSQGIQYVLLIGNPGINTFSVPMINCWPYYSSSEDWWYSSQTDFYYADLTGDWDLNDDGNFCDFPLGDMGTGGVDRAPEVYVGRIPVYTDVSGWNTTLENILQKIIDYTNQRNITWRKNALLPESFLDATTDGAYLAEAMKSNYLNARGYTSYTLYQQGSFNSEADSSFASNAELRFNSVLDRWKLNYYGIVNWWGHGDDIHAYIGYDSNFDGTIMDSFNAIQLNNTYPAIVFQTSCENGDISNSSNLGYALLKQGAIGTYSASKVTWYDSGNWSPSRNNSDPAALGYYIMERITNGEKIGRALYLEKALGGLDGNGKSWMNLFDFNLYGDPYVSINDVAGPLAPTAQYPNSTVGSTTPVFRWSQVSDATGYTLYVYTSTNAKVFSSAVTPVCDGTVCRYTFTAGLTVGNYKWAVKAKNGGLNSQTSNWLYFSLAAPAAPIAQYPSNAAGSKTPTFRWSQISGATGYNLYIFTTANVKVFSGAVTPTCDGTACRYVYSAGLTAGNYKWSVKSRNAIGYSAASNWLYFTLTRPETPTALTPSGAINTANPTFTWTKVSSATGYNLFIYTSANVKAFAGTVSPSCAGNMYTFSSSLNLTSGNYKFSVKSVNAFGSSYTSNWVGFTVTVPVTARIEEEFNGSTLNPSKWTTSDAGKVTVANSQLTIRSGGNSEANQVHSVQKFTRGPGWLQLIVKAKFSGTSLHGGSIGWLLENNNPQAILWYNSYNPYPPEFPTAQYHKVYLLVKKNDGSYDIGSPIDWATPTVMTEYLIELGPTGIKLSLLSDPSKTLTRAVAVGGSLPLTITLDSASPTGTLSGDLVVDYVKAGTDLIP